MKLSHFLLTAICIFFSIMFPLTYYTQVSLKVNQINREYADYLTTACYDGLQEVDFNKNVVFANENTRKNAKNLFYESLICNLNARYSSNEELIKYYIPCMAMIDRNGFYINYNMPYSSNGETVYQNVMTTIQTWSNKYDKYIVQFFLSDKVRITDTTSGISVEGNYDDIGSKLSDASLIPFLGNKTAFEEERNYIVIGEITKQIEYYMNEHNSNNVIDKQYTFTIPETKESDWARMLEGPTIIAFMQGKQPQFKNTYLNIYSLAGSEITTDSNFFIKKDALGDLYYHVKNCAAATSDKGIYETMESCAKKGAFPCTECIR